MHARMMAAPRHQRPSLSDPFLPIMKVESLLLRLLKKLPIVIYRAFDPESVLLVFLCDSLQSCDV